MFCLLFFAATAAQASDLSDAARVEVGGDPGVTAPRGGPVPTENPAPIINGQDAETADFPNTGAMLAEVSGYPPMLLCSSTLIAPDTVLLAAHCLDPESVGGEIDAIGWSRASNLVGWADGTATDWPDDVVMGTNWVGHEQFSLGALATGIALNYDIGLLFLDEPIDGVTPAYLPTVDEATQIEDGSVVDIVGWGFQDENLLDDVGEKQWGESYVAELAAYEFQVGVLDEDVRKCHGDSGGPTFFTVQTESAATVRIIGVTSHAYDDTDCTETGGVDTRVDYYLAWIDENMRAACDAGTRVSCDEPGILPPPPPPLTIEELTQQLALVGCSTGAAPARSTSLLAALGLLAVLRRRR